MCGAAKLPMQNLHDCNSDKYFKCLRIVIVLKNYTALPQNCDVPASFEAKNRAKAAELPGNVALHTSAQGTCRSNGH
jgi:hypothetical protein